MVTELAGQTLMGDCRQPIKHQSCYIQLATAKHYATVKNTVVKDPE